MGEKFKTTPGSGLTYTISYANDGDVAAHSVVLTEIVPAFTESDFQSFNWEHESLPCSFLPAGYTCFLPLGSVAAHDGGSVTLIDTDVLATASTDEGIYGRGIQVVSGSSLTMHGGSIADNAEFGLLVQGEGSAACLEDVVIDAPGIRYHLTNNSTIAGNLTVSNGSLDLNGQRLIFGDKSGIMPLSLK